MRSGHERTMTTDGRPTAVVSPEFNEDHVPLRNAWIATLRNERDISRIIGKIGKILPGVSHLKRCSAKRLVLAFAPHSRQQDASSRREIELLLATNGCDMSLFVDERLEMVQVPAMAPRTRAQARRAAEVWPTNFHPDPLVERNLDGSCFDRRHLDRIDRCARMCIEAAVLEARGNGECNGSAVVYDPIADEIVTIAASRIDLHPMWHATILAVDLVASGYGDASGGAYKLSSRNRHRWESERSSSSSFDGPTLPKHARKEVSSTIAYPANLADVVARLFAPASLRDREDRAEDSSMTDYASVEAAAMTSYLCTNYWVFLLREPCSLCAMALVHSRVSNVFYGTANEYRGVLGSRAMLHELPGLNHRYRVWKGIREDECRSTIAEISDRSS